MHRTLLITVATVATLAIASCERRDARVHAPGPDSARAAAERAKEGVAEGVNEGAEPAERRAPLEAVGGGPSGATPGDDEIVRARCENLSRCGAIGDGRSYDSVGSCLAAPPATARDELSAECAPVPGASSACALAWRAQACGAKLDVRPDACRRASMCR